MVIVEQRDYHVYTGKLPELVKLYEEEGIAIQQEVLGGFVGAFTTEIGALSTYTSMWRYDSFAEREQRRAALQARDDWKAFLAKITAADPHPAEPDPDADPVLGASVEEDRWVSSTARSRSSREGRRASATRSPTASRRPARASSSRISREPRLRPRRSRTASASPPTSPTRPPSSRSSTRSAERCGSIDILVNNAGLYASLAMRPFTEIPLDEWRQVMDVNVASMFLMCRAVVPVMQRGGGGRIVNISSGTPFRGVPFLLHYVTSKGAIVAFTRALAKEIGKNGVLVNCVAPGFTMSAGVEAHPEVVEKLRDVSVSARTLQRDQVPEDVVGAVVYFAGPGRAS